MQCISSVYCRRHLLCSRLNQLWKSALGLPPSEKEDHCLNLCPQSREKSDDTLVLSSTFLLIVVISGLVNLVWWKIFPEVYHVSCGTIHPEMFDVRRKKRLTLWSCTVENWLHRDRADLGNPRHGLHANHMRQKTPTSQYCCQRSASQLSLIWHCLWRQSMTS